MLISRIQVLNYKSFRDSEWIEFQPGINIITGQNSAGKTALLEALALDFQNIPHRSLQTLPERSSRLHPHSKVNFSLELTAQEVKEIVAQIPRPYYIPHPVSDVPETIQVFKKWLDNPNLLIFSASVEGNLNIVVDTVNKKIVFNLYDIQDQVAPSIYNLIGVQEDVNNQLIISSSVTQGINQSFFADFFRIAQKQVYRFYAERLNVASCSRTFNPELAPNASNLPEVLGILQGENPELFNLFNKYVSIVFPQIKQVTISQLSNPEIKIWYVEPSTLRADLSFPLSTCGTGIGQVLSILYVVLTAQNPRVIIIDEPQSFLHPGAAKKLIEIFRELGKDESFPQHQYIISTHSPTIIASAEPSTLVMLRYLETCETMASVLNANDTQALRTLLDEVGVRLSDVFGMDNILWVEGATEEKCYPLIIQKILRKPLRGTQVLAVKNPGDLEGKHANIIFDVYDKLSGSSSLLPPAIGFLLDKELRTPQQMEDLRKRSSKPVKFLPRRMYENYLLHPKAIATILNNLDEERDQPITASDIDTLLTQAIHDQTYSPKNASIKNSSEANRFVDIDGAKVLKYIFSNVSECRIEFSKTRDSVKLTEWLIDNQPEFLAEISELLDKLLPPLQDGY